MADPFIGQLMCVGFNFAPPGWLPCDGRLISIAQNNALFALLGTTYGGDGRTTFGLPDLRGRTAISAGQGPGLPIYAQGQNGGRNTVTLSQNNLPAHQHPLTSGQACSSAVGTTNNPVGNVPAAVKVTVTDPNGDPFPSNALGYTSPPNGNMAGGGQTGIVGNSQPVDVTNPYLALNWIIATSGIFPSRP